MPTHVADIDLSSPLAPLDLPAGTSGVLALVRRGRRPIGLVRVRAESRVPVEALRAAIDRQVEDRAGETAPAPDSVDGGARRMRASVVVCTRERPDELRLCLEAMRPQAEAGHEVIVVDNAPTTERTAAVAAAHPYLYVREPRPGLDHARNRGLAAARNEVVAFTDDDCAPDPEWLAALTAPYADESVGATTGLVLPHELETAAQEAFEAYCANRRRFRPRVFRAADTAPSAAGVVGMGANMSFRRSLIERLGGFDPRFDGGTPTLSGGDTEAFARVLAAGAAIAYRPDAVVWHRHRREIAAVRRVVFGYGVGLHAMLLKRLVEDHDLGVLMTAPRWLLGPPLKAAWNALRRRPAAPADLALLEMWGALHGPRRFRAAGRSASTRAVPLPAGQGPGSGGSGS